MKANVSGRKITVKIHPRASSYDVAGRTKDIHIKPDMGGRRPYPAYEGEYYAASQVNETQIFETEDKTMKENFVVLPIPYYDTTNPKGGKTVYIGE